MFFLLENSDHQFTYKIYILFNFLKRLKNNPTRLPLSPTPPKKKKKVQSNEWKTNNNHWTIPKLFYFRGTISKILIEWM